MGIGEVVLVMLVLLASSLGNIRSERRVVALNREVSACRYDDKVKFCEPTGWLWMDIECSEPRQIKRSCRDTPPQQER